MTTRAGTGLRLATAACAALRAWVAADAPGLTPAQRGKLLSRARVLTGKVVGLTAFGRTTTTPQEKRA